MSKIPCTAVRLRFYEDHYPSCIVKPEIVPQALSLRAQIEDHLSRYVYVASGFKILPTFARIVGVLHYMESGFDFGTHLANGDPLTEKTVHEPRGLIADHDPPYTWEEAAIAALQNYKDGWGHLEVRDIPSALQFLDQWNGLGYWELSPPIPSPYLWSGTNLYKKGKFGADEEYDPEEISKQIGCVPILKAMGL